MVRDNGKVAKIQVISGPPMLVKAAQDAVKKWKFEPTVRDGMLVPVETTLTVTFASSITQ